MKPEIVFLEIAKKDLEAARRLSETKLFPQAVFYLEQSVEKAIKSFGIWSKVIDEAEAKNVQHKPVKIYFKMAELSKQAIAQAKFRISMRPRKYGYIDEGEMDALIRRLDEFKEQFPDDKSLLDISHSREKIDNALELIRALKVVMVDHFAEKGAELGSSIINTGKLEEYRRSASEKARSSDQFSQKPLEEQSRFINDLITPKYLNTYGKVLEIAELGQFCYHSLLILCGIFAPHASKSRYPFQSTNPLEVYRKELPLIDALADFIEVTMYCLSSLDRLYGKTSSLS